MLPLACVNMAANETVNSHQIEVESIVNRWLLDYYYCSLLELFTTDQYDDFCGIRSVVESVLVRPLQTTEIMPTKVRVMQFLSRIHEGEKLELSFESDESVTPLESALAILEIMSQENATSQQDFKKVKTSLKEMIVGIFIRNEDFDRAKQVLTKHFPKPMVGKKAIYTGLIRQKSKAHEVIEKIDFQKFKEEMLDFCRELCPLSVPFLLKAANRLIDERKLKEDDKAASAAEQDEAGPSTHVPVNIIQIVPGKQTIILKTSLEAVYKALSASDEKTFTQAEEEVERETQKSLSLHPSLSQKKRTNQDPEQTQLFQRNSGSPMEASPADQPPQADTAPQTQAGSLSKTPEVIRNRRLPYTLARLVVEPDSQGSILSTAASQDPQAGLMREEPQPSQPVTVSKKNCKRASTSLAESSSDDERDFPGEFHNKLTRSPARNSRNPRRIVSSSDEDAQESSSPHRTPPKQQIRNSYSKDQGNTSEVCITDSSLDSSPNLFPLHRVPRTSSTPQRNDSSPSHSKWKQLYNNAKESKDTWSDEESYFNARRKNRMQNESPLSSSGARKKMWTDIETQKLKEGVQRFGEGNWSKIKAYYSFKERTNVQLKDRWRTMKKINLV
ncbi:telomeric repeat binding factor a isoform X2 [Notolabrus celidotus]|uniref:telomeric repeat binding factor a isoform X2 n=1 Tax=Notolabrus celidotus TaxID=1203425 RepID=UPI0014905B14|nr:telomeric repeat binding factor a isoform X2 [Notolabrus celidotus]